MAKLLAFIMLLILVEIECKVCPSGFEYYPGADACYRVIFQRLSWYGSSQVCRSVLPGVHVAAITSAAKQQAIRDYLEKEFKRSESSACVKDEWIGGGKSVWLSGQTKDPSRCDTPYYWKTLNAVEIPFEYTNWIPGEPSCFVNERCAHIAGAYDYKWNDGDCSHLICALCEY